MDIWHAYVSTHKEGYVEGIRRKNGKKVSHVEWSDLDDIDYDCEAVWQDAKTVEVEREV